MTTKRVGFTPGPWKVVIGHNANAGRISVDACENGVYKPYVADVRSIDREARDNSLANARLIAAAPEMVEALRGIEETIDGAGTYLDDADLAASEQVEYLESKMRSMANVVASILTRVEGGQ